MTEIFVGRQVNGKKDIHVSEEYISVSRKHARFYILENDIYVEDLSQNGTYVNGVKVQKKKIAAGDKITLGVDQPYKLDGRNIIDILSEAINADKTDYSKEFLQLKEVYAAYQKELDGVVTKIRTKSLLPRIGVTVLVIVAILMIDLEPTTRIVLSMGAGVLGMGASLFGNKTSISQEKKEEVIIKHNRNYVCPKCKTKLQIHRNSWNMLNERGTCLNNKCDAKFN